MDIKGLNEQLRAELTKARDISVAAEKAGREFTADERNMISGHLEAAAKVKAQIKQAEADEAMRKQLTDLGAGLEMESDRETGLVTGVRGKRKSIGEMFVNALEFKDWMKRMAPGGQIPESARGIMSPPVELKGLGFKTLLTGASDTSAGAFVETDYTGIYEPLGRYPNTVLDLVARRTTGSDVVEFVRQTTQVTQAAPTQEANVTTYAGATGEISGEKPEGAMAFEKVTETVKTIAVWIPATKRALSDAAQLRGIIDQELRDDLAEEFEDQLINGDGTGENFTGILNTSGILSQAWDTDLLTTARKAITTLHTTGKSRASAWAMNPADFETIDLLKDGENRYYYGGPMREGQRTLWGIPVVECDQVDQGSALLGDWRKAVVWDRERASIQVSDSHEDFFIRNMVAILAEMRAAFGLIRPSAFVEVAMESGT